MATHQAGPENLESLLQSTVQPGDTVELRGEFTKPIKLQVSRVTLRSADLNAPPTIKSTIRLAQPEQKVLGLKVVPGASPAAIEVAAPGCEVGWCEITGFAARGIVIGKTGIGAHVHHNWVHDQAALTGAAVAGIIAGTGRGTSATPIQALIESNRLEKLKAFQAIEFKSSRNKARGNTVIGAEIVMRHGNDNRTEGNWVKDGLIGLCGERPVSAFDQVFGERGNSWAVRHRAQGRHHRLQHAAGGSVRPGPRRDRLRHRQRHHRRLGQGQRRPLDGTTRQQRLRPPYRRGQGRQAPRRSECSERAELG